MKWRLKPPLAALALAAALAATSPARSQTLLVGEVDGNRIDAYTYSSATNSYAASGTISGGGLQYPFGMVFDGGHTLYVASLGGTIFKYDTTSKAFSTFVASPGPLLGNGLALDPSGNLYLSSYSGSGPGSVLEYNSSGALIHTLTSPLVDGPTGLAYHASSGSLGTPAGLYISSSLNNSVVRYDSSTGTFSTYLSATANPTSKLSAPAGLSFDSDGRLLVADYYNSLATHSGPGQGITVYPGLGTTAPIFFSTGTGSFPADVIAAPKAGDLLVSEYTSGRVAEYTKTGTLVSADVLPGTPRPGPLYMVYIPGPTTVAVTGSPAPEPASFVLVGLGGSLGFVGRRWLRRPSPSA